MSASQAALICRSASRALAALRLVLCWSATRSQRIDGVNYLDTDQWLAMKPVLKAVEDALAQAGKK